MKKRTMIVVGMFLTMSLLFAGSVLAQRGDGYGMRDGHGYGCWSDTDRGSVDLESLTKFQKETLPLRDELLTKRLALSQEYDKEDPDTENIAKLRKEIVDIQMNIDKVASKYGLDGFRQGRGVRGGCGHHGYGAYSGGCF